MRPGLSSTDWKSIAASVYDYGEVCICAEPIVEEDYRELCRQAGRYGLAIFRWKGHLWAERAFK